MESAQLEPERTNLNIENLAELLLSERLLRAIKMRTIVASETVNLERFQIRNRNGIWEVKEHGRFYGDYFKKEQAIDAVRIAKQNTKIYR